MKSKLVEELNYENVQDMIGVRLSDDELELLEKIKHQKIVQNKSGNRLAYNKSLEEYFFEVETKKQRNEKMIEVLEDGYSQIQVARFLGVSRSLVSKVVRGR